MNCALGLSITHGGGEGGGCTGLMPLDGPAHVQRSGRALSWGGGGGGEADGAHSQWAAHVPRAQRAPHATAPSAHEQRGTGHCARSTAWRCAEALHRALTP